MADKSELVAAVRETAKRIGIDPSDLLTAMSYETGGTLDPWKRGPTTKWGTHRGLIQWGEPQARKYGVTQDMPVAAQVDAAGRYLVDRGVKPGMGLLDVYSAINAGAPGLYNRSDAHAGGAPGTVADKVASMAGHRMRANALLGLQGSAAPPAAGPVVAASAAAQRSPVTSAGSSAAPLGFAPAGMGAEAPDAAAPAEDGTAALLKGLMAAQADPDENRIRPVPMAPINYVATPGTERARALLQAMQRVG